MTPQEKCEELLKRTSVREHIPDCLLWTGLIDDNGYGYFTWQGNKTLVHAFIAKYYNKTELAALNLKKFRVVQSCGVFLCIAPHHLSFATGKPEKHYEKLVEWWKPDAAYNR